MLFNLLSIAQQILVDNVPVTVTDNKGAYTLQLSKPASYKLDVQVPGLRFTAANVQLSPNTEHLPQFTPSAIEQCGQFKFAASSNLVVQVYLN